MTQAQFDASATSSEEHLSRFSAEQLMIKTRLSQLSNVEQLLLRQLTSSGSGEREATQLSSRSPLKELAVNATVQWKSAFVRVLRGRVDGGDESDDGNLNHEQLDDWNDSDEPGSILRDCSEDMARLWSDPGIRRLLTKRGLRMEEMAGLSVALA